jgi:uncharacterized protein involved in response to NO
VTGEPYQLLFPIGLAHGVLGTLVWIAHRSSGFPYPGSLHAQLMIGGFFLSFAAGFLMTALPLITGTRPAGAPEKLLAAALACVPFALVGADPVWFYLLLTADLLLLGAFAARRIGARQISPPPSFVFLALGLATGLAGAATLAAAGFGAVLPAGLAPAARNALYQGFSLCLVLGVGAQLLPVLLGHSAFPVVGVDRTRGRRLFASPVPFGIALPLASVAASLALDAAGIPAAAFALRALAAAWIAFACWKVHRLPRPTDGRPRFTRLQAGLWLSAWGLVAGLAGAALAPARAIHLLHVAFICGYGLMILMVASRVALARGGHGLALERTSRALPWAAALVLIAAATRLYAGWSAGSYASHLAYAAATWIAALGAWAAFFLPRVLRDGGGADGC